MVEAVTKAGSAISGMAKGTGGTIAGVFKLLFFIKARWTLTILLVLFYSWGALQQSIEQKNFSPFVFEIGGRFASADETLYWQLKEIESNEWRLPSRSIEEGEKEGFWRDTKSLMAKGGLILDIISMGWFVYIMLYFFYWIFNKLNNTQPLANWIIAITFVVLLQSLYGEAMLYLNYEGGSTQEDKYKEIGFAMTPLKGTTFLVFNAHKIFGDALFKGAVPFLDQEINSTINQTNSE